MEAEKGKTRSKNVGNLAAHDPNSAALRESLLEDLSDFMRTFAEMVEKLNTEINARGLTYRLVKTQRMVV